MFDTAKFLTEHFTSVEGVMSRVRDRYGRAPKHDAVRKWFTRGRIASEWWPVLLAVIELDGGEPASVARHMKIKTKKTGGQIDIFG